MPAITAKGTRTMAARVARVAITAISLELIPFFSKRRNKVNKPRQRIVTDNKGQFRLYRGLSGSRLKTNKTPKNMAIIVKELILIDIPHFLL